MSQKLIDEYLFVAEEHIRKFKEADNVARRKQCYDIVLLFVDNANLLGSVPQKMVVFSDLGMEIVDKAV